MGYTSEVLSDNPLAYWRLDEVTSGAKDSVTGINWAYGKGASVAKPAIVADGGYSASGNGNGAIAIYPATPSIATMEAWILMPSGTAKESIVCIGSGSNGFGFGIGSGTWQSPGTNLIVLIGNIAWLDTGYSLSAGIHHIVLTVSAGTATAYVDGVQRWTASANPIAATGGLAIGGIYGSSTGLSGNVRVDNVAFYNYVLTSAKVSAHYNANGSTYSTTILADSPLHFLRFDEATINDFTNSNAVDSGGSNTWAYGNGVSRGKAGLVNDGGTAISGSGSGPIASLSVLLSISSMEAWIRMPSGTAKECIASIGNGGNGFGFGIGSGDWQTLGTKLIVLMGGVAWLDTGYVISPGIHHIALTVSGGIAVAYVDGVQRWTTSVSYPAPTGGMGIGGVFGAGTGLSSTVDIDNVAFYNYALSSTKVNAHYTANGPSYSSTVLADTPTSYLKFDDPAISPLVWTDSTSNSRQLTATNGLPASNAPVSTVMGGNSSLLGGIAYAYHANPTWATSLNSLTIEAWVKTSNAGSNGYVISLDDANLPTSNSGRVFTFSLSGGVVAIELFTNVGYIPLQGGPNVADGLWHHVAAAWDGAVVKIYVDGVQTASTGATGTLHAGVGNNLLMGATYVAGAPSRKYSGFLDELAIYNTALSAARINTHYNAGLYPPTPSPFRGWGVPI